MLCYEYLFFSFVPTLAVVSCAKYSMSSYAKPKGNEKCERNGREGDKEEGHATGEIKMGKREIGV
jgi:hypothetical protein